MDNGKKIYTVSQLNQEIKVVLEDAYPEIWVEGEISNFRLYPSGHMYFSLKDADAQVSVVMFQGFNRFLKFKPEDGLKAIARGKVSAYPKRGEYQIIVSGLEPAGKGSLQLAFEQLKAKLDKEGLFCAERKKPIPLLPRKIGIVTSPTGAAIRDILSILDRRFANVEVLLYPVRVQGDEAKDEIAGAIGYLNEHFPDLDVLLVGRGGGSYEDLWAFNEEIVARAIACSRIPIISCVGHEIDFTIADFVADLRAPTPSAAAELVVKNKSELVDRLARLRQHIVNHIGYVVSFYDEKLKYLSSHRALTRPQEIFEERLRDIDDFQRAMTESLRRLAQIKEQRFLIASEKLNLLSPLNTLGRGYAICWREPNGAVVRSPKELAANDRVRVRVKDGEFTGRVESIS